MYVRVVGMRVHERLVIVGVRVRLAGRIVGAVRVLMVFVVAMRMGMMHRFVLVPMLVPLGEVEVESKRHQCCCSRE